MGERYPPRTPESDLMAHVLQGRLDAALAQRPFTRGFMVSVVTTKAEGCFVGFSGDNASAIRSLQELSVAEVAAAQENLDSNERKLAWMRQLWFAQLDDYIECQFSVDMLGTSDRVRTDSTSRSFTMDADLRHKNLMLHSHALKRQVIATRAAKRERDAVTIGSGPVVTTAPEEMHKRASEARAAIVKGHAKAPAQALGLAEGQAPPAKKTYGDYLKSLNPNWNCAEPKALAAAARAGKGISGMTTFFYGQSTDDIYQRYKLATAHSPNDNVLLWQPVRGQRPGVVQPHRLQLCRPCDVCQLNEGMVMATVSAMDVIARGGGKLMSRSFEAPARMQTTKPGG